MVFQMSHPYALQRFLRCQCQVRIMLQHFSSISSLQNLSARKTNAECSQVVTKLEAVPSPYQSNIAIHILLGKDMTF